MARVCSELVSPIQRGFVQGRNPTDNVVDMEASAMKWTMTVGNKPCLAMFGVAAAFPSVAHKWIFWVLCRTGIPDFVIRAIWQLYSGCAAVVSIGGV
eukprot:11763930-Alexandrium_andersonii.AAC.1